MGELSQLKGLGQAAEKALNEVNISSKKDLINKGVIAAYIELGEPHLCFLYALAGAIEDKSWLDIAQNEKTRLIIELDNYKNN